MGTMNLHSLRNSRNAVKKSTRVGRGHGSGKGKTSGRGHKGQMARSGHKHKPAFEGGQMRLVRRMPKRGFNNACFTVRYVPVQVGDLMRFEEGTEVTPELLQETGMANSARDGVKILGTGELSRKLTVKAHAFSETAKSKITGAGGKYEIIQ